MLALGCEYALNLDGGGSSTAWVAGKGIVNYPSDNKKWDHQGERSVATALLFFLTKPYRP
jgi:exopolysaccharide biosynthesis protein